MEQTLLQMDMYFATIQVLIYLLEAAKTLS
jgi:hypothetical protein